MIIYGTNAKLVKTEYIGETCPNCNSLNTMSMSIFQRWAHIFWIPTFPIGKTGASHCTHCQQVLNLKQMPEILRISYDNLKSQTRIPIWTFSGVGVIILIGVAVTISNLHTADKVTKMIPALKAGDILQVKLKDNVYTLARVSRVKGDSVFLLPNQFQTDKATGINDLKSKGYETQEELLTTADLQEMNKKEQILDIERD
jgi:hypothetical protein